jgi:ParB-like chromosome segregation protein Spo0J
VKQPKFEMWPIEAITPYELNSKIHDERQIAGIATSIERFGFDQPIVVDKDGVIIKGHGRRLACLKLGLKQVPVLVRDDLSPEQANAARIADNRVAVGDFDTELLKAELEALDIDDLRGIFDDKELDFLAVDLTSMDSSLFVENLDEAVASQEAETEEKFKAAESKRIPIGKALGFKDIAGADHIHLNRFMAAIETRTGLKGDQAFVSFIKAAVPE